MRWSVDGAYARNGQEATLIIDAASADDAEAQAMARGLLVSSVRGIPDPPGTASRSPTWAPPPQPQPPPAPAPTTDPDNVGWTAQPAAISYARRSPDYNDIVKGAAAI